MNDAAFLWAEWIAAVGTLGAVFVAIGLAWRAHQDTVRARADADRRVFAWATMSARQDGSAVIVSVSVMNQTTYPLLGSLVTVLLPEWTVFSNQSFVPEVVPPGETKRMSREVPVADAKGVQSAPVPALIAFRDPSGTFCARRPNGQLSVGGLGSGPIALAPAVWENDLEPRQPKRPWWRRLRR